MTKDTQTKSVKTVVDSRALASKNNPGTWVPAELIFESVELGELQPLEKYHSTPAQKGKAIRRRVKYTVEDDVRMLDFLEVRDIIVYRKDAVLICVGCVDAQRRPTASL